MNKEGVWELLPVDPSTTDEERRSYNVLPLEEAVKSVAKFNKK